MAKIKKVANGEYIGANKYTIKDAGGGKSTVDFAPDSVLTPGTEVGAELLNEMQLNALYTLDTNRVVEGQKEVYVANLEGFTDFTKPDLSFYLKINANNTNVQTYLRLDTTDYLIKCKINDLTKNSIVACRKVGSEIIVLNNYMQRQDDAIWGGLDGGGLIEDPSVTKVVGKRYIGADGKAYICLVPSNINNSTNYMPCNVVDNLDKLQNLSEIYNIIPTTIFGCTVLHKQAYRTINSIKVKLVLSSIDWNNKPIDYKSEVDLVSLGLPQNKVRMDSTGVITCTSDGSNKVEILGCTIADSTLIVITKIQNAVGGHPVINFEYRI